MTSEDIRIALQLAECVGDRKSIAGLAERMEDENLGVEAMPDDYVEIILYVIRSPVLRRARGAAQFVTNAYLDHSKLSQANAALILEAICANFASFESEELCLVSADYLARRFEAKQAAEALRRLSVSTGINQRFAVRVGVETFLNRHDIDSTSRRVVSALEHS